MTSIATDDLNDILVNDSNNFVLLDGIQATLQDCEHKLKAQRGEMVLQIDEGVPYEDTVFNNTNLQAFRAASIEQLLDVPNVLEVIEFTPSWTGDVVSFVAVIRTIYGVGSVNV